MLSGRIFVSVYMYSKLPKSMRTYMDDAWKYILKKQKDFLVELYI